MIDAGEDNIKFPVFSSLTTGFDDEGLIDQRGQSRPVRQTDIGAIEVQDPLQFLLPVPGGGGVLIDL